MKPDTERTIRYQSDLHKRKDFLNVHLSKELRQKMKTRSALVKKGDRVKVLIGDNKGKEATVLSVKYYASKVYLEGLLRRKAQGREVPIAFEPSNLMLVSISSAKKPAIEEKKETSSKEEQKEETKTEKRKEREKEG